MPGRYEKKYSGISDYYDSYVKTDYDLDFWLRRCRGEKEVLEITCGTGRLTIPIAKSGVKITGLDISKELLAILRRKCRSEGVKATAVRADMVKFSLGKKFPLIFIPFQSLQELTSPEDHLACFRCVQKHLAAGGRFIISAHNPQPSAANEGKILVSEFANPKTGNLVKFWVWRRPEPKKHVGVALQLYEEYGANGKKVAQTLFKNTYYLFSKGEIEELAGKAGFSVSRAWGNYDFSPLLPSSPYMIYEFARKS